MLFGVIFSILTATFTLSSNNTVKQEGDVPAYSECHYERSSTTGQKGQMTAGNTTHLRLSGWDGCAVRSVRLEMHSNSKSGAGSLKMKVGKQVVWEIEDGAFSSDDWAGRYSTEWVDIYKGIEVTVGNHEAIDILITASENSLYVNRYIIEYEAAAPTCYTVSFVTGLDSVPASITQTDIGASVVLPMWRDTAEWYFQGWSEVDVSEDTLVQTWLPAGSEYVPRTNTYLWAVYSDVDELTAVKEYTSGQYVMTMWNAMTEYYAATGMAMSGVVKDGQVPLVAANMMSNADGEFCLGSTIDDDMIYQLDFSQDSTMCIEHVLTGEAIGYKGTRLDMNQDSVWRYKVLSDSSLAIYFAHEQPSKTYALYVGVSVEEDDAKKPVVKSQLLDVANWKSGGFVLFPIMYPQYTSWPFGKPDIEEDDDTNYSSSILNDGQYLMHIGRYRLYVKDGKKYLLL